MMPVFMIGTRRSGSNLLRLMINQLPEVAAPHPPDILQRMMPLVPLYGNLNDPKIFYQLVDDVCRLVELDPVPWEGVTLNRNDVASRCFRHEPRCRVRRGVRHLCREPGREDVVLQEPRQYQLRQGDRGLFQKTEIHPPLPGRARRGRLVPEDRGGGETLLSHCQGLGAHAGDRAQAAGHPRAGAGS